MRYIKSILVLLMTSPAIAASQEVSTLPSQDTLLKSRPKQPHRQLKEIRITGQKQLLEKKIDRIIFNAEKSISGTGGDALELLEKIPGIRVDHHSISLIGKGTVSLMINEKLINLKADELSSYLKSIPSDHISKVEIMSNPSGKYDAQGNNGLINIILKNPANQGLQGSVSQSYSKATYSTFSSAADLNYRDKKLIASTNFNVRNGSVYSSERSSVFYPTQTWDIENRFRNFRKVLSGQFQIDYQLSKKVLIGALYHTSHTDFHSYEKIISSIYNRDGDLDSVLVSDANTKINSAFSSANLFLKKQIDTNGKLFMINADWFSSKNDSQRHFDNNTYINGDQLRDGSYARYLSSSNQDVTAYTIKADADIPYHSYQISFGGKLSFIHNTSDISFYKALQDQYLANHSQANNFKYTENTQALYVNINRTLKKWSAQIGLRGEYTQTKGKSSGTDQSDINRYLQLFPTAFLSYHLNEQQIWSLNFGRRINRPSYKSLNPFRWYSNQYAYTEGNPFLKPSYSSNFELSHFYKNLILTTLSFSHTNNGYSTVNFTDMLSNVQISKPINFISSYNYLLSNSVSITKMKWLQSNNEFDIIYNRSYSSFEETIPSLTRVSTYLSSTNEFYMFRDKTFSVELSFWYQSKNIDGLQIRKHQYNLNTGAKMLILNKHLHLTFSLTDLLKSNIYRYTVLVNNIKQTYANYYDARQLRMSVRYVFGNNKVGQKNRQTGNSDETKRNK
jgi:hypothetical protein